MAKLTARSIENLLNNSTQMDIGLAYRAGVYLQQLSRDVAQELDPRVIRTIVLNIHLAGGPPMERTMHYLGVS